MEQYNGKVPRPVRSLEPETARKIAAGEVIDRPAAIVRELIDNALDAGASSIQVELEQGGIEKIRVVDDGFGMTREDMEACAFPHATSKITAADDLLYLSTLGFRGEALASVAAVSRLEITSVRTDTAAETSGAWKLETSVGLQSGGGQAGAVEHRLTPAQLAKGTIVQASGLFENFPARRVFLKRPAGEGALCQQTFIEKALPWPAISFRLISDGKLKFNLLPEKNLKGRFMSALKLKENEDMFRQISGTGEGFSFDIVLGLPEVSRTDRKQLFVFVNGRRIWEYSLLQAVEYGGQGYFPNGTHPVACLFLTVDPSLVDFNIHPAKKEARFKDIAPVHRAVSSAVRDFFRSSAVASIVKQMSGRVPEQAEFSDFENGKKDTYSPGTPEAGGISVSDRRPVYESGGRSFDGSGRNGECPHAASSSPRTGTGTYTPRKSESPYEAYRKLTENAPAPAPERADSAETFRYIGSALGVFLLAEKDGAVYVVDQHAAHERILFNRFMETAGHRQELLVPYILETETEADDRYLESCREELEKAGFTLKNEGGGTWTVSSVPEKWNGTEDDLRQDILRSRVPAAQLLYSLAALTACRGAVKDGDVLDRDTACELLKQAFALDDPHCPHGRPLWTVFGRDDLYRFVKRT